MWKKSFEPSSTYLTHLNINYVSKGAKIEIPEAPELLKSGADEIYKWIYMELHAEGRAKEKYKFQVAIAANALFLYRKVSNAITLEGITDAEEIGLQMRTLRTASMEWSNAAKALMLTPESETKIGVELIQPEKPKTFEEVLNEMVKDKKKKSNYGHRTPSKSRKAQEQRHETRKKSTNRTSGRAKK